MTHPPVGVIDVDAFVLRGCRVLGTESSNGRRYPRATISRAKHLFEGVRSFEGHRYDLADPTRLIHQRLGERPIGKLTHVRQASDGTLFGDLVLNRRHPRARRAMVEAICGRGGLSPAILAQVDHEAGDVLSIGTVASVDFVEQAATSESLFEGEPSVIFEGRTVKVLELTPNSWLFGNRHVTRQQLLEGRERRVLAEADDEDDESSDHRSELTGGFERALKALIARVLSGDVDEAEATGEFRELCKAHGKLVGGSGDDDEDLEEEGERDRFDDRDTLHDDRDIEEDDVEGHDDRLYRPTRKPTRSWDPHEEDHLHDDETEAPARRRRTSESRRAKPVSAFVKMLLERAVHAPPRHTHHVYGAAAPAITNSVQASRDRRSQNVSEGKGRRLDVDSITDGKSFAAALRQGGA
jgi:hypothetical protein